MIPLRGAPAKHRWPWVTLGLIAVNLAIFLYQLHIGPQAAANLFYHKGAVAAKLSRLQVLSFRQSVWLLPTMFSSLFLHAGWLHLIGNMWFLWVFGNNIEDSMGHLRYVWFYLVCGVLAALAQVFASPSSVAPMVGASGAISGVMGAYLVLYPRVRVHTLIFLGFFVTTIAVPAYFMLLYWALLQAVSGAFSMGAGSEGGVAFMAHLGGFVAGAALIRLFARRDFVDRHRRPEIVVGPPLDRF